MMLCFYRVRGICPEKDCRIEYGSNGKCPGDLGFKEEEPLNTSTSEMENILKKDEQKLK